MFNIYIFWGMALLACICDSCSLSALFFTKLLPEFNLQTYNKVRPCYSYNMQIYNRPYQSIFVIADGALEHLTA